jgi:hypothetical protein
MLWRSLQSAIIFAPSEQFTSHQITNKPHKGFRAIIEDQCTCGEAITLLTDHDALPRSGHADGKQAVHPNSKPWNYNILRCQGCLKPADETVKGFKYGKPKRNPIGSLTKRPHGISSVKSPNVKIKRTRNNE